LVWISPDRTWAIFDKPPQLDSVSLFPWDQNSFANRVLAFACQEGLSFGELSQAPSMEGGLLQRLDRDTSGLVCAAFNKEAKARFRTDFSTGAIEKEYLALVTVPLNSGSHSLWFEEAHGAKVRASLEPRRQGEEVKLSLEILNTSARGSLVSIKTRQGRRHVVRAGLATLGAPLLGDKTYGGSDSEPFHQLHAFRLSFPFSPRIMEVNPPQSFLDASARLGLDYSG
jgi:23S rRNA pseudouridine1911/1915/1917 synthase